MIRRAAIFLCLAASAACFRLPPPDGVPDVAAPPPPPSPSAAPPPPSSATAAPGDGAVAREESPEVAELLESGPSYVPYDESPRTVWDSDSQAMLTRTLLPVLRRDGLPARTQARLWLLIRSDGTVADAVLQTSSGHEAFDEAAGEVARRLRFVPARRAGQPVATWLVRAISLLMQ